MLKPEKVVKFYAYTTKLHVDSMAEALMEFDDVHVEPPEGLPGVKPPEGVDTSDLDAYEEIVRALERTSALTGIGLEEIIRRAKTEEQVKEKSGYTGYKELISQLDDLVGKYLALRKEIELSKKAKSILKERMKRLEELESKLADIELKIREYYSTALEVTEEGPSKLRLGRMILEVDREILRAHTLVNTATDPSMTISDVDEILRNALDTLEDADIKIEDLRGELTERRDLIELKSKLQEVINLIKEVRKKIADYAVIRDRLAELKAVESMWSSIRDTIKNVPELSPLVAEKEPAITKVAQRISELEEEIRVREGEIRSGVLQVSKLMADLRESYIRFRDELLSIKEVAAGEAERRVSELIEEAKPVITEKGKLEEEIKRLKRLLNKSEVEKLKSDAEKLLNSIRELSARVASLALSIRPRALLQKLKTLTYVGEEIAVASGWVPASKREEFDVKLKEKLGNYLALEYEEPSEENAPPSKVSIPSFLKPISLLTHKLYGLPSIFEIDPTALTAIFFPIMFGMMFGDMGHGLTLAVFGAYLYLKTSGGMKDLGGILVYAGIAAAFFGYLYGMVFFVEFTKHPIMSPLHDTFQLIAVALLFGAFELMVGFVLNTINKLMEGDVFAALFEYKGLSTLVMYAGAVYAIVKDNAQIMVILHDPLFQAMAIPLMITVLAPIYRSIKEGHGIGMGATEAVETFLESVLALLSNSLSYVRLAAFAVIHEVFGVLAAQLIAGQEIVSITNLGVLLSPVALISFIFVNIAVMGLEGMLSFIQATRLTFYEFFTKFYRAAGRQFRRVSELLGPSLS